MDLIEETTSTDIELRRGPSDGVRRLLLAGLAVAALVLVVSLLRPSGDTPAPASNAVTSTSVAPNSRIESDETDDFAPDESPLAEPSSGGIGFGLPVPLEIPDLIDVPATFAFHWRSSARIIWVRSLPSISKREAYVRSIP